PAGFGTVFGGALFGLGMTIAGMCAVGTLQRLGEGTGLAWAVFAGVLVGAALYPFQPLLFRLGSLDAPARSLADSIGPLLGYALTLLAIAITWTILLRPRRASPTPLPPLPVRLRSWLTPALLGGAALGLLNTAQMAVTVPWTAGYPLALIPSLLTSAPAATLGSVAPPLALNAGLVLGAALSSLQQKQLRLTCPRRSRDILIPLLGGILMGWGIRAAHACNIGGFFSAIPSLALSGWLYLAGLLPGAWLGTKVVARLR
ncbi:MAG: YeeE/YedE family protein, partial [Armatimonadota bacterium]|nr:YeeE/YedE family protein [Armatimonadota bacterium]